MNGLSSKMDLGKDPAKKGVKALIGRAPEGHPAELLC
jgi:hypothetical protein